MSELITVKQLADKLGVPKSKVSYQSRKLDDSLILQQNGTNYLTERAQLLITQAIHDLMNPPTAEDVEKKAVEEVVTDTETVESDESEQTEQANQTNSKQSDQTEQTDETNPETEEEEQDSLSKETSQEMMDLLYEWIDSLDDQIEVNQEQLEMYHDQLRAKDEQIDKLTQLLNQSQQLQLQQQQQQLKLVEDIEFEKSLTWWQKLFGKK
ncbi:hypothetical protein HW423_05780 [Aerococcaceae bacterium INB8]|uniref:DUF536 domain-containing protein n=1 Tax=Ruoffia halotolerans TaxID=2748684 RepID=A0A839A645_9LACT|nr:hypothetical protein [Ruoffia halotolerans]MBA5729290.1 hypothetical protein [Ruoffia halotolerans]